MSKTQEQEIITSSLLNVFKHLKATDIRDHTGKNLEFLWLDNTSLADRDKKARELFDQAIMKLEEINPLISKQCTEPQKLDTKYGNFI